MLSDDERPGGPVRRDHAVKRSPAGVVLAGLDEIEVVVERLVSGGDGLARYQGIPIFVPLSAPGDRLLVRLSERKPHYGRAEIVEILTAGPGRREPPCEYFLRCGGCNLQHLEDGLQSELKAAATREALERLGRLELPEELPMVTGQAWGYRLRTQLHSSRSAGEVRLGYFERGTHTLVPVESCPVCRPEIEAAIRRLDEGLGDEFGKAVPKRLDLACGDQGRVVSAPLLEGFPHGEVSVEVADLELSFDARCFFQAHRTLLGDLVSGVVGDWQGEQLVDLYSGVGVFALAGAARYETVTAVEGDRIAARYARGNARRNRLKNVEVVAQAVETWIERLPDDVDRLIVDPPRAGLPAAVRRSLTQRRPKRLTYVSCHPAAMARDLRQLTSAEVGGGAAYEIETMTLFDLFPQTGHVEAVAQLKRLGACS